VLGDHPIDVVLLATDLESSKDFYAGKLGLEILNESEEAITYKCGGDSQLAVTKSTTGTADEQTQAGWRVDDLAAELAELRARGVEIQEYDMPGLKTVDGVRPGLRADGLDRRSAQERAGHHAAEVAGPRSERRRSQSQAAA
jgi:catechol 2,3-dioxygenase-like lactoylglutathione lyase family enzyme